MKNFFTLLACCLLPFFQANAQGITYTIDLNSKDDIYKNVRSIVKVETKFWESTLKLDSALKAKLESNNYALYNQYIQVMRNINYTMENLLLAEQKSFKERRERFMKMFLNKKQYKTYQAIVVNTGKKQLKKYKDEASLEIRKQRVEAAGWNVTQHRIIFK